ncbi:LacI family DNA-binding transcriptional regulator [Yinghuangia soli]|uniref:LacI family transcriptional regulator n=1 Tax=Yinghuangia soli TaxID=2908204 RepID=A0AA41U5H8_9ACTN|nr:LacI family DNA-binding transcriptional regulator [Yinghuangia soli]MCF2533970.1 LacI family transcriptional regulator [Yinghuangia soli]
MDEPQRRVGHQTEARSGDAAGPRPPAYAATRKHTPGGRAQQLAPRVRLIDVAREAGLSKTTISAALNGTGRLSDEVRAHARETAWRMGYRPNATARLLRAGHSKLIGFAVREYVEAPWVYMELPYFTQLTNASARAALEHGHALVLLPNHAPREEWADLPLDAVCIVDPMPDDPLVEDFLAAGTPVVTDRRVEGRRGGYWVETDYHAATRGVLDHLAEQGARDIAIVAPDSGAVYARDALLAQAQWSAERGIRTRVENVATPGYTPALAAVERAIGGPDRPDALFVVTEVSPPMVVAAARRHGYTVPDDLLVVCASEDALAEHAEPPVTTLSTQPARIAAAGIKLLVEVLDDGYTESRGAEVPTRLVIRASSLRTPLSAGRPG